MKIESVKFILMAQHMKRAVVFYRDAMGLELKLESDYWSELTHGDAVVALHGGGNGQPNRTGLGFQVADLEAACKEVAAGGGTIVREPEDRAGEPIRLAEVQDTEGNIFALSQYVG